MHDYWTCAKCGNRWPAGAQMCDCRAPRSRCCHAPLYHTVNYRQRAGHRLHGVIIALLAVAAALALILSWYLAPPPVAPPPVPAAHERST